MIEDYETIVEANDSDEAYRIGRSLYSRVIGILGPYVDVEGIAQ